MAENEPNQTAAPKRQRQRSVLGLLMLIAVVAIQLKVWVDGERQMRRSFADHFGKMAQLHRQGKNPIGAAWAEQKQHEFEQAVDQLWRPSPRFDSLPPSGWTPPTN